MSTLKDALPLPLLQFYILRQILKPFILAFVILMMALSLERLLRLVDLVSADGAPLFAVFKLMACLMPHYLGLALPWSFFIGALLTFRQLQDTAELTIIQSVGISLRMLLPSLLLFSAALAVIMIIMSGFVAPHTRYLYRTITYDLSASGRVLNLKPGALTDIGNNIMVRAETVQEQGRHLESVFAEAKNKNNDGRILLSAKTADVVRNEETGQVAIILKDGNLIREQTARVPEPLAFSQYVWHMPSNLDKKYGPRGRDERELTLSELINNGIPKVKKDSTSAQDHAEFNARIVQAFSLPLLTLLALPLALIGGGRSGKAYGIVIGVIMLVLYDKVLGLGKAAAANENVSALIGLWFPWFVLACLSWGVLVWKTPALLAPLKKQKPKQIMP